MTREELNEIATRWIVDIWQLRDLDAVDRLHTPDFIDRSPASEAPSLRGYRNAIKELFEVFPDFYTEIEYLVPDEETQKVAIRWIATGTHTAEFMGYAASHKEIEFSGIEILSIKDGRISERWGEWDLAGILEQLEED